MALEVYVVAFGFVPMADVMTVVDPRKVIDFGRGFGRRVEIVDDPTIVLEVEVDVEA
jgi:hypothetical protein